MASYTVSDERVHSQCAVVVSSGRCSPVRFEQPLNENILIALSKWKAFFDAYDTISMYQGSRDQQYLVSVLMVKNILVVCIRTLIRL